MARITRTVGAALAVMLAVGGSAARAAPNPNCDLKISPGDQTVSEWQNDGSGWYHPSVTLNADPNWTGYVWTLTGVGSLQQSAQQEKSAIYTPGDVAPGAPTSVTVAVSASKAGCGVKNASATVRILNVETNHPPVAKATATPSIVDPEGSVVTLDGSLSSDADGDGLTYAWVQLEGPAVALSDEHAASPTFTAPDVGPGGAYLKFQLTVTDSNHASSAPAEVIVTVTWEDVPPVARLTANGGACPLKVPEGAAVTLDGSTSGDSDDGIAAFAWSQPSAGPPADLTLDPGCAGGPSATQCTFTAPALEQRFAIPQMTLKLTVTDAAGLDNAALVGAATCDIEVLDVTPPVVTVPASPVAEATSPAGAAVTFPDATAFDTWNGPVGVTCSAVSGATFPVGATGDGVTPVTCTAYDRAGNRGDGTFTVTVRDTTAPAVTAPASVVVEATGPAGAAVSYGAATAWDAVDLGVAATCAPAAGTFPIAATPVVCSATDRHGNTGTASFTVTVQDTTPPALTLPADRSVDGRLDPRGEIVTFQASALDVVDGPITPICTPASGSWFPFGTTTVSCTATDAHGNPASGTFKVTVQPYRFAGFFQPVDNLPVVNAVKGGATVPVKFRVFTNGGTELTSTAAVDLAKTRAVQTTCGSTTILQDVEVTTTGGTSLRYDATGAQFVLNWQTPRLAGSCWRLDLALLDGSTQSASFKLK